MAVVRLGLRGQGDGAPVVGGTLCMPRVGAWHADLVVDAPDGLEGKVELRIGEAVFAGTASRGGVVAGALRVLVVAGADGLRKTVTPKHYTAPTLGLVLSDMLKSVGESLSPTSSSAVLGRILEHWTTLRAPAGVAVRGLIEAAAPEGCAWRHLLDGTVWIGAETWPKATHEARELSIAAEEAVVELGLDEPVVLPGTTVEGRKVDYAEIHVGSGPMRARVWWA